MAFSRESVCVKCPRVFEKSNSSIHDTSTPNFKFDVTQKLELSWPYYLNLSSLKLSILGYLAT